MGQEEIKTRLLYNTSVSGLFCEEAADDDGYIFVARFGGCGDDCCIHPMVRAGQKEKEKKNYSQWRDLLRPAFPKTTFTETKEDTQSPKKISDPEECDDL